MMKMRVMMKRKKKKNRKRVKKRKRMVRKIRNNWDWTLLMVKGISKAS